MQSSDSSALPRQLRLLGFLPWPGTALAIAGETRSPKFRCAPFVRDVAIDPGRASAPRVAVPHILPSTKCTASAPTLSSISWLIPTPHTIAVYVPAVADDHATLATRRPASALPGPDFYRLDRTSLAWRTHFLTQRRHRRPIIRSPRPHG
jgi:hypothetical protein